MCDIHPSLA